MSRPRQGKGERNAGAFLGPHVLAEDSDREPEPESRGMIRRLLDRLTRRAQSHPPD